MDSQFNLRFTGLSLLIGGIFVFAGYTIMPVSVTLNFSLDMLPIITNNLEFWVRSFQILVFGYFIRIIGIVALSSLHQNSPASPVLNAGVMVCSLGMLVAGIAEGYYMHTGGFAQWKVGLIPLEQHNALIASLEVTNEWASCIKRFGRMFTHLGFVFIGWGLLRGQFLERWLGIYATVLGIAGICLLMILDKDPNDYLPMGYAVTIWFVLTGIMVYRKSMLK